MFTPLVFLVIPYCKSMILNLDKIRHLSPAFGGRFEALLENEEILLILFGSTLSSIVSYPLTT